MLRQVAAEVEELHDRLHVYIATEELGWLLQNDVQEALAWKSYEIKDDTLELEAAIGSGGYGTVFSARYFSTRVAVKHLTKFAHLDYSDDDTRAKAQDYVRREIGLLMRLRHPSIVLLLGVVMPPNKFGGVCLVMELCEHGSLDRHNNHIHTEAGTSVLPSPATHAVLIVLKAVEPLYQKVVVRKTEAL